MAKLRHIAMQVPDPHQAAEFYMKVFGMKKVGETDWENARGVYLSDGVVNLALLNYRTVEAAGADRGCDFIGIHHIGFWVDDVAATRKAMEAAGARYWMGEPVAGGGFYEVKYRDPNGVVVDITANGWGGAAKDVVAASEKAAA
jgi:methylmalonyl-CoA/ethylmalonyl-CoA epimerase